jgi:ABC-type glycerol-3-phosphate transport system permease component
MNTPTSDPIRDDLSRVRTLGDLTMWLAVLVGIGGLVAGGLMWSVTDGGGFVESTRPYLWSGVAVAAGSVVAGVVLALLGAWAVAWARVAMRTPGVAWQPTPVPPAPVVRADDPMWAQP